MLADNNSPFFAIIVYYAIFSTVKAFPSKDIFGCSHYPIPVMAWPSADLHLHKVHGYTHHLWNVHGMRLLKSADCYDFTGCEIITNLERLPSSHCPFKLHISTILYYTKPLTLLILIGLAHFFSTTVYSSYRFI